LPGLPGDKGERGFKGAQGIKVITFFFKLWPQVDSEDP
jgi:hypothetical protein